MTCWKAWGFNVEKRKEKREKGNSGTKVFHFPLVSFHFPIFLLGE